MRRSRRITAYKALTLSLCLASLLFAGCGKTEPSAPTPESTAAVTAAPEPIQSPPPENEEIVYVPRYEVYPAVLDNQTGFTLEREDGVWFFRQVEAGGEWYFCLMHRACLQFEAQFVELDREEFDRHVTVEGLGVGPALHSVAVCKLFVYREEGVEFVVVDVAVLEGDCVYHFVDAREYLIPLFFVLLHAYGLLLCQIAACCIHCFLAVDPRGNEGGKAAAYVLTHLTHGVEAVDRALCCA